jgi:hypothetical protein
VVNVGAAANAQQTTNAQQTNIPTNKTLAASVGSAIGVVVVWLLNTYVLPTPLPVGVEAAVTTIVTFALSWIVPPSSREAVVDTVNGIRSART